MPSCAFLPIAMGIVAGLSSQATAYYPSEVMNKIDVQEQQTDDQLILADAERKLRASFSSWTISDFEPSPIPGFYQVSSGGRLLYYSPDPELIIFGQVFNSSGVDLTAKELSDRRHGIIASVDLSDALIIGDEGGLEIVEFTNPDCPYCRQLDQFLQTKRAEGHLIKRKIVFTTRDPRSAEKAISVLCAEDPEEAFATLFRGGTVAPASCLSGQERLSAHTSVSDQVGVTGTPSLLVAGEFHTGFPQAKLEAFLQSAADLQRSSAAVIGVNYD